MSKQNDAKIRQNYNPKPDIAKCGNCQHYESNVTMIKGIFGGTYKYEKEKKCVLGGFSVKTNGTCSEHCFSEKKRKADQLGGN